MLPPAPTPRGHTGQSKERAHVVTACGRSACRCSWWELHSFGAGVRKTGASTHPVVGDHTTRPVAPCIMTAATTHARRLVQPLWNALDATVVDDLPRGLVLCVSGGPDSRALLEALATWRRRHDGRIVVASVDHGRRAGARAEVDAVVARAHALAFEAHAVVVHAAHDDEAHLRAARLAPSAAAHSAASLPHRVLPAAGPRTDAAPKWHRPARLRRCDSQHSHRLSASALEEAVPSTPPREGGNGASRFTAREGDVSAFEALGVDDRVTVRGPPTALAANPASPKPWDPGRRRCPLVGCGHPGRSRVALPACLGHCGDGRLEGLSAAARPCLQGRLIAQGIVEPTDVQREAIPPIMTGTDVAVQCYTGSGKARAPLPSPPPRHPRALHWGRDAGCRPPASSGSLPKRSLRAGSRSRAARAM